KEEGRQEEHDEKAKVKERVQGQAHKAREILGQASKQDTSARLMDKLRVKNHNKEVKIEE
ncbi:MAG: hypothetical protein ACFFEN_02840, partial [Candidatus Thorarchaeota archaeon]